MHILFIYQYDTISANDKVQENKTFQHISLLSVKTKTYFTILVTGSEWIDFYTWYKVANQAQ